MHVLDVKDWLLQLVGSLSKEQFGKVLILLWAIWKNRNTQIWEGTKQHPCDAVLMAFGWLTEFLKANSCEKQSRVQRQDWAVPQAGWLKCNSDGAFVAQGNRAGIGVVVRDHDGQLRAAAAKPMRHITSPFHAELAALMEGVTLAERMNLEKVIFETDCAILAAAVNQNEHDLSLLSFVLEDLKDHVHSSVDFKVVYAPREANKVAHILANKALCNSVDQTWFGTAPEYIRDAILNECTR